MRAGLLRNKVARMGKDKTPKKTEVDDEEGEEEESQVVLSVIASPLAKDKLVKKVLKLVKTGKGPLTKPIFSPDGPPTAEHALHAHKHTHTQHANNTLIRTEHTVRHQGSEKHRRGRKASNLR